MCVVYRTQESRRLASKWNETLHPDFADCSALAEALQGRDAHVLKERNA